MKHAKFRDKRISNPATELSSYVHRRLEQGESKKPAGLTWEKNWSGLETKETVDVVGLKGNQPKVLLEIERLRESPEANVLKVWMWLSGLRKARRIPPKIYFFQAFSEVYTDKKALRKKRAVFLAKKMCSDFSDLKYRELSFGLRPKSSAKGIGGASMREARKMVGSMLSNLRAGPKSVR